MARGGQAKELDQMKRMTRDEGVEGDGASPSMTDEEEDKLLSSQVNHERYERMLLGR